MRALNYFRGGNLVWNQINYPYLFNCLQRVGYDAYRNFENSGEITLKNLVLCAIALDEIINEYEVKKRKRGSRNV